MCQARVMNGSSGPISVGDDADKDEGEVEEEHARRRAGGVCHSSWRGTNHRRLGARPVVARAQDRRGSCRRVGAAPGCGRPESACAPLACGCRRSRPAGVRHGVTRAEQQIGREPRRLAPSLLVCRGPIIAACPP